jgi:hypothetical protein
MNNYQTPDSSQPLCSPLRTPKSTLRSFMIFGTMELSFLIQLPHIYTGKSVAER